MHVWEKERNKKLTESERETKVTWREKDKNKAIKGNINVRRWDECGKMSKIKLNKKKTERTTLKTKNWWT